MSSDGIDKSRKELSAGKRRMCQNRLRDSCRDQDSCRKRTAWFDRIRVILDFCGRLNHCDRRLSAYYDAPKGPHAQAIHPLSCVSYLERPSSAFSGRLSARGSLFSPNLCQPGRVPTTLAEPAPPPWGVESTLPSMPAALPVSISDPAPRSGDLPGAAGRGRPGSSEGADESLRPELRGGEYEG